MFRKAGLGSSQPHQSVGVNLITAFENTSSNTHIQTLTHPELGSLTTFTTANGEVWFLAQDVCGMLDLANTSQALSGLDDDEKAYITINDVSLGTPKRAIVSEAGVYALSFKSRKPGAKAFTRWVTHDVLPQVRRTGAYVTPGGETDTLIRNLRSLAEYIILWADGCKAGSTGSTVVMDETDVTERERISTDDVGGSMSVSDSWRYLVSGGADIRKADVFSALRDSGFIEKRSNKPTAIGIKRGVVTTAPLSVHLTKTGRRVLNEQYAHVTPCGLIWLEKHFGVEPSHVHGQLALPA